MRKYKATLVCAAEWRDWNGAPHWAVNIFGDHWLYLSKEEFAELFSEVGGEQSEDT